MAESGAVDVSTLYLVTDKTRPVAPAQVDKLEAELGVAMPRGYRELMARAGSGAFVNELWVLDPDSVRRVTAEQRSLGMFGAANSKLWANYAEMMRGIDPAALVAIARSNNGDELVFRGDTPAAASPSSLLLFPRHADEVCDAGHDLTTALGWFARSGTCVPRSGYFYNTEINQTRSEWTLSRVGAESDGGTLDDLLRLFGRELQSDGDGGDELSYWFFFRRLQGLAAVWEDDSISPGTGSEPYRLTVLHDADCLEALNELCDRLRAFGWTMVPA